MRGDGVTAVTATATGSDIVSVKAPSGFTGGKSVLRLEVCVLLWRMPPRVRAVGLTALNVGTGWSGGGR